MDDRTDRRTFLGVSAAAPASLALARPAPVVADNASLRGKVLCGYQGWFRCPGDPSGEGWRHWSRDPLRIAPDTLTVEMWPDLTGFPADETFEAPGFTHPDGSPARLFSSAHPGTVRRHFGWMRDHGIDGAFLQRFLVDIGRPSADAVLRHARAAAAETGRVFAVGYDLSGTPADRLVESLERDWTRLAVAERVTADAGYLRHRGRPVVFVWGFFPDRFRAEVAHRVIDVFHRDGPLRATLIGGVPWYWRREADPGWARSFRRLDVLSPWNVGNYATENGERHASMGFWRDDVAEAKRAGVDYLPVAYPGFGCTHLKGPKARTATIPRLGGRFFWRQFVAAAGLGLDSAYVAMFDEVDEGTAVFKVSNRPPTQAEFSTFEGLPADWYLRLTGEGARLLRGEIAIRPGAALPIEP